MRFLKTKILMANEALKKRLCLKPITSVISQETSMETPTQLPSPASTTTSENAKIKTRAPKKKNDAQCSDTKNITINYGKAIISFATSPLALPYLKPFLQKFGITLGDFISFIGPSKSGIGSIGSFRNLLLVFQDDSDQIVSCKKVFQLISEVFLKYFSVNWIIHGKVVHKMTYLKYRAKMLRRVQNPEHFTYIRQTSNKRFPQ